METRNGIADIVSFDNLCNMVTGVDKAFADNTAKAINKNVTARNWLIGYYIVNYEQHGNDRAQYGAKTLQCLAERANSRSLSYRNLRLYRQFFLAFPNLVQPIYNYVLRELGSENTINISFPINSNLAIADCQIGQLPFAQLDEELQLPPDELFSHLSFTHFSLIMGVEKPWPVYSMRLRP